MIHFVKELKGNLAGELKCVDRIHVRHNYVGLYVVRETCSFLFKRVGVAVTAVTD